MHLFLITILTIIVVYILFTNEGKTHMAMAMAETTRPPLLWPCETATCWTTYPNHQLPGSIDIQAKLNSIVLSMADGVVIDVNSGCPQISTGGVRDSCPTGRGCGNLVTIAHADGARAMYCHLTKPLVNKGDNVTRGQQIGISGSSGRSSGPHLHVWIDSKVNGSTLESVFVDKKCARSMERADTTIRDDIDYVPPLINR